MKEKLGFVLALAAAVPGVGCGSSADTVCADIEGEVGRSNDIAQDGVGTLYISVMSHSPVFERELAVSMAEVVVEEADMRDPAARLGYRIECVPKRDEPYYLMAFFDEDEDATTLDPIGPEAGELINIHIDDTDQVLISSDELIVKDIDLNVNLPDL